MWSIKSVSYLWAWIIVLQTSILRAGFRNMRMCARGNRQLQALTLLFCVELNRMIFEVLMHLHAWGSTRCNHESTSSAGRFNDELQALVEIEKEQGAFPPPTVHTRLLFACSKFFWRTVQGANRYRQLWLIQR
jgi:hypothetical protein